jgi:L-gulonolactone oxidase
MVAAQPLPIEVAIEQAVALADSSEFTKVWWLPHTDRALVFTADRTDAPCEPAPVADWIDEKVMNPVVFGGLVQLGNRIPSLIPLIHRVLALGFFRPQKRVDDSFRSLHLPMPPVHRETEWAVPLERASDALGGVRRLILDHDFRVNFIVELRYVAGDALPLSPAYRPNGDVCYIGGYTGHGAHAEPYMDAVEALAVELDGRPHWGKRFCIDAEALQQRYPGWSGFAEARAELDPSGTFASPFIRRLFGL